MLEGTEQARGQAGKHVRKAVGMAGTDADTRADKDLDRQGRVKENTCETHRQTDKSDKQNGFKSNRTVRQVFRQTDGKWDGGGEGARRGRGESGLQTAWQRLQVVTWSLQTVCQVVRAQTHSQVPHPRFISL